MRHEGGLTAHGRCVCDGISVFTLESLRGRCPRRLRQLALMDHREGATGVIDGYMHVCVYRGCIPTASAHVCS